MINAVFSKMRAIAVTSLVLSTSIFCVPSVVHGKPSALLTANQSQSLKALGIAIAVPTYVPKGFEVSEITTQFCRSYQSRDAKLGCKSVRGYQVLYRNLAGACFAVYGHFTAGIGGGAGEFAFPVKTALLGETAIGFGKSNYDEKKPSDQQLNSPQPNLSSFPAYKPGTSIVYGMNVVENLNDCGVNQSITPLEFKKILQSLEWLQ